MTKFMRGVLGFLFCVMAQTSCWAEYIVNTGPGPSLLDLTTTPSARYATDQFVGVQLVLPSTTTIAGVEGWMTIGATGAGRISLYSDVNNAPGTRLLSGGFVAPLSVLGGGLMHAGWLGALDLDWRVEAASYWLTFEVDLTPDLGGLAGGFLLPSVNQLGFEVFSQGIGQPWIRNDSLGLGVRVSGTVPEPGTLALLALGLAGLMVSRREGGCQ